MSGSLKKAGFIGTGIMGGPMACNLAAAGFKVAAWNRSREKSDALGSGILSVTTAAEAAADADGVVCMLSSGPVCDEILLATDGVLAAMRPGSLLIVMSSIPVETAHLQASVAGEAGVLYVDAPVSGGEKAAIAGTLAIMSGGTTEAFEAAMPLLAAMGRPVHVGPAGAGQLAKLINQGIVATTLVAVAEAMTLAERGGADPLKVREALLGGFADSAILKQHAIRMVARDFVPGGPAKYQLKDTSTAVAHAATLGLALPMLTLVDKLFADMVSHGDGELDHSAIIREIWRTNALA
ncbi:NAD(P)-dependent oxidoreductase [Bradyrhizobium sp. STM 3566]|uniref:NAD(P)-dependent oxidoreductase n=1 Tax=Bradyrhizobium sp. STM 3566 TaxID=578928 RepID=UPI003890C4E9